MTGPPADVRVSAILTVHEPGEQIEGTLDRLADTLGPGDELIVVDDGSQDGTSERLTAWQGHPGRIPGLTFLPLPGNVGVAAARNLALSRARGQLVWFVDWDDTWRTDILDRLHAAWSDSGATVAICGAELVDARGVFLRRLGPRLHRHQSLEGRDIGLAVLEGRIQGYLWNKLFSTAALGVNPFPPMRSQSDFVGTAELISRQPRVTLIPERLYAHVRREGSLTNTAYPSTGSFAASLEVAGRVAQALLADETDPRRRRQVRRALLAFRYRELHLTVANNALRLSRAAPYRRRMLGAALRGMTWRDVVALVPHHPVLASRAGVLLATRQRYPLVYDAYGSARRRLHRWRRPRHRTDHGRLTW